MNPISHVRIKIAKQIYKNITSSVASLFFIVIIVSSRVCNEFVDVPRYWTEARMIIEASTMEEMLQSDRFKLVENITIGSSITIEEANRLLNIYDFGFKRLRIR